ncbi:hypothetical protein LTS15_007274 [Exophiala xenobiotica]|nr:hypothetical protein LTS15_007274 [Exophiala xenobiotica]
MTRRSLRTRTAPPPKTTDHADSGDDTSDHTKSTPVKTSPSDVLTPATTVPSAGSRSTRSSTKRKARQQPEGTPAPATRTSKKTKLSRKAVDDEDEDEDDGGVPLPIPKNGRTSIAADTLPDSDDDSDVFDGEISDDSDEDDEDDEDFFRDEILDLGANVPEETVFYALPETAQDESFEIQTSQETLNTNHFGNYEHDFASGAIDILVGKFPSMESELRRFLAQHPDRSTLDSFSKSWEQSELRFAKQESELSGMELNMICQSSGDPAAPIAMQLNHPTLQLTGKLPGRTLDPKVLTTKILIQGGVDLINTYTFDTYARRCAVRYVQKNGKSTRAATEPETWSIPHQAIHLEHIFNFWSSSPAKVIVVCGGENSIRFCEKFNTTRPDGDHTISIKNIGLFGYNPFKIGIYCYKKIISKIIVFVYHPEHLKYIKPRHREDWTARVHFACQLAGVRLPERGFSSASPLPIPAEITSHCHQKIGPLASEATVSVSAVQPQQKLRQITVTDVWKHQIGAQQVHGKPKQFKAAGLVLTAVNNGDFATKVREPNRDLQDVQSMLRSKDAVKWYAQICGLSGLKAIKVKNMTSRWLRLEWEYQNQRQEPTPFPYLISGIQKFYRKYPQAFGDFDPTHAVLDDLIARFCISRKQIEPAKLFRGEVIEQDHYLRTRSALKHLVARVPEGNEPRHVTTKCNKCGHVSEGWKPIYERRTGSIITRSLCYHEANGEHCFGKKFEILDHPEVPVWNWQQFWGQLGRAFREYERQQDATSSINWRSYEHLPKLLAVYEQLELPRTSAADNTSESVRLDAYLNLKRLVGLNVWTRMSDPLNPREPVEVMMKCGNADDGCDTQRSMKAKWLHQNFFDAYHYCCLLDSKKMSPSQKISTRSIVAYTTTCSSEHCKPLAKNKSKTMKIRFSVVDPELDKNSVNAEYHKWVVKNTFLPVLEQFEAKSSGVLPSQTSGVSLTPSIAGPVSGPATAGSSVPGITWNLPTLPQSSGWTCSKCGQFWGNIWQHCLTDGCDGQQHVKSIPSTLIAMKTLSLHLSNPPTFFINANA